jgi:hypothetical protein
MTSQFWKWLSHANARTALLAAVIAFVVAAAYWVWREMDPGENSPAYLGDYTAAAQPATNRVELLAYIKLQQKNQEKAMNNPFFRKPLWRPDPRGPDPATNPANPSNPQKPVTPPPPAKPVTPPPPPPPPPKEAPVMFRGTMTRPDGVLTALIENQKTKRQRYFIAGEKFLADTVEGIGPDSVTLRHADGKTVVLERGQVVKIRED